MWEAEQTLEQEEQQVGEGEVILAGKDLLGQGTWLGVTKSGRVSVLTNYRTPRDDDAAAAAKDGNGGGGDGGSSSSSSSSSSKPASKKRSRGKLVLDFLHGWEGCGPRAYAERVMAEVGMVFDGMTTL